MGTTSSQKGKNKKYLGFNFNFLIEHSAALAFGLCFLGIIVTVLLQVFYGANKDVQKNIQTEVREIKEHLDSTKVSNLLILYGSGSVQNYLETEKSIKNDAKHIILPTSSLFACKSLSDDVFIDAWMGNVIIMSSTQAQDSVFMAKGVRSSKYKNVLEVFLGIDTLYIKTSEEIIYKQYPKGIRPDELTKLLKEKPTKTEIYLTSEQSGTWNEYNKITNNFIKENNIQFKEYDKTTNISEISKNFIILTRKYYEPEKNTTGMYKINVM